MFKILSYVFSIFLYEFKGSEFNELLHTAFPPDKLRAGIGSSNSVFIGPNFFAIILVNWLRFFCEGIFVIGKSDEVAIVSSPFSNADQPCLWENEYLMTVGSVIIVFEGEF